MGFANAFVLALLVIKQVLFLLTTLYLFVSISSVWFTNHNSRMYQPSVPWRRGSKEREARKGWWIRTLHLKENWFSLRIQTFMTSVHSGLTELSRKLWLLQQQAFLFSIFLSPIPESFQSSLCWMDIPRFNKKSQ